MDERTGFIVGGKWYTEAIVLATKDGGETWARSTFYDVGHLLNSATIAPNGSVYGIGFEGKLLYSHDTGKTWSFKQLERFYYRDVSFRNANQAIAVGGISFGSGMRIGIDGEGNLQQRDSFKYQLNCVQMVTNELGYCCGFGIVLKTINGGNSWVIQSAKDDNFSAMDVHGDEIWMCGTGGSVFHTTNGGANWTRQRNGNDLSQKNYGLNDIKFTDKRNGWAVGENGVVLHSDDGGNHWMEYDKFTTNTLTSIFILGNNTIIVVGANGTIYKLVYL